MSVLSFLETFAVTTGPVGTTMVRTGYGFRPKAIIVISAGRTEATNSRSSQSMRGGLGWGVTGAPDNARMNISETHAAAAPSMSYSVSSGFVFIVGTAFLHLNSLDADGITLDVVNAAFPSGYQISILALGGAGLIASKSMTTLFPPDATSSVAYTGVGFKPNAAIFTAASGSSGSISSVIASIGAAAGANGSIVNKAVGFSATNAGGDTAVNAGTSRKYLSADCMHVANNSVSKTGRVTSWDPDGMTVAWTSSATFASGVFNVLLLKTSREDSITLHEFNNSLNTATDISVSGISKPTGGLLLSSETSSSSASSLIYASGMFDRLSSASHTYESLTGGSSSSVTTTINYQDCLRLGGGNDGLRPFSFNNDGMTFRMSSVGSGVSYPIIALLFGGKGQPRGGPIIF